MRKAETPSVSAVTSQVKLKNLRAAAAELKKLEPLRKQFHNFDRLVASVHSPLNNAEKLLLEARALIPGLVNDAAEGEDPATLNNRTRAAISRLIKARQIVKDDAEINALLKRCLAALEAAETKVSVAQSHVVRGHWDDAYKNIREAARVDDSPDVQETNKYITKVYKVHLKDNAQFQSFIKVSKRTGLVLGLLLLAAVIYSLVQRYEISQAWESQRIAVAGRPSRRVADRPRTQVSAPPPQVGPPKNATAADLAAAKLSANDLAEQEKLRSAAEEAERLKNQKPVEKDLTINATEELGTSLGKLAVGTKITLHYESGSWCAWLNPKGFSPDQPSEGGKVNCLAICGVKDSVVKVLKVVGYKTHDFPYTYTVAEDCDRIVLRINDAPGSFDTNDGSVVYRVLVTPPAAAEKP